MGTFSKPALGVLGKLCRLKNSLICNKVHSELQILPRELLRLSKNLLERSTGNCHRNYVHQGKNTLLSFSLYSIYLHFPLSFRLVLGSGGHLPIYSSADALGQALLYRLNGRDLTEIYVAHEQLRSGPEENLQLLLSCDRVLVFTTQSRQVSSTSASATSTTNTSEASASTTSSSKGLKELRIMINISHVDLVCARTVSSPGDSGLTEDARYYIELVGRFDDNETRKRPQVRCDNERIARRVTQKINYARNIFDEMTQAVIEANDDNENEL